MNRKLLKRLQTISHRLNRDRTEASQEFLTTLKKKLAERKYRADLSLVTSAKDLTGKFSAEIKFNSQLGYPSENDILTLVAQNCPSHQINWGLVDVDPSGIVTLVLEPSVEVVPIKNVKKIPPEFTAIGTGIYKRAVDASGKVNEIWTLKKTNEGLALYRNKNDLEITAEEDTGFKAGDVVDTPYGPGIIKRFDDLGNAFVQVGNQKHLVGAIELKPYSVEKEKKKLEDYYAEAYGDREFAQGLVKKFDTQKKK